MIASTTAVFVNPIEIPRAVKVSPSSPKRPNAASRPIPATAGGSTRGSSTSVTTRLRPGNRLVAMK